MKLDVYRRKRDFQRTPEPRGGKAARRSSHRFVIQKHDARRLHYDLRLELDGVFKSWAVPKGPSLDPRQKRLAVHVEDHPLEYGRFEGVIPKPEYGAGTVLVWDRGTWIPQGDAREGYRRGRLHFELKGEKLRGGFRLVRTSGKSADDNSWLLIKDDDEYASDLEIVDALPDSVATGRNLADVRDRRRLAPRREARLPTMLSPQLATLVDRPPTGDDWVHEIKYDGYRLLCRVQDHSARLYSRNGKDLTAKLATTARAVERLAGLQDGWLDGELVALRPDGRTSFNGLQAALSEGRDRDLVYYVFDLPYFNGQDLTSEPLRARKARLAALLRSRRAGPLRYSDHVQGDGAVFQQQACEFGLEGIICKRADSPYRGTRSSDWLKVKCHLRQEFVVGGYTDPEGERNGFGALLLGVYDADGALRYCGRVGTGFDELTLARLHKRMQALKQPASPFPTPLPPDARRGRRLHWLKPGLVVDVEFTGWTQDRLLRHASFRGVRDDKTPHEVMEEKPRVAAAATASARSLPLTHADKVLYPEAGLTKRDLALYYEAVAEQLLPHLRNRPLTLVRCPDGWSKECFFQKHAVDSTPTSLRRLDIAGSDGVEVYLAADTLDAVWALVQMGVLEIHVWGARADRPQTPDRLVFDLDPDPTVPWEQVIAAAHLLRQRLASLDLVSFPRTTGGKGLHVVVPIVRRHDWNEAKAFAKALAEDVVRQQPDRFTARLPLAARRGKIFIDYLRNGRGATAITNFSARARAQAPVAVPLRWDEVTPTLRPGAYTVSTVRQRLAALARDPWHDFEQVRQSLTRRAQQELGLMAVKRRSDNKM